MNKAKSLYESGSRAGCVRASIYIHWPYCAKRCSYCNFNKYVWKGAPSQIDQERWKSSFRREISTLLDLSGTREVVSVFFGGGTPSMMAAETIQVTYLEMITLLSILLFLTERSSTSFYIVRYKIMFLANYIFFSALQLKPKIHPENPTEL